MAPNGQWRLAPAYDVTFCEGPAGYHQMDVMGEALAISRTHLLRLAEEAEVPQDIAGMMVDGISAAAARPREPWPPLRMNWQVNGSVVAECLPIRLDGYTSPYYA